MDKELMSMTSKLGQTCENSVAALRNTVAI